MIVILTAYRSAVAPVPSVICGLAPLSINKPMTSERSRAAAQWSGVRNSLSTAEMSQ